MSLTMPLSNSLASARIAIVGATGAVGKEALAILASRSGQPRATPANNLTLLASPRSAGKSIEYLGEKLLIHALTPDAFNACDIAIFCANSLVAHEFVPHALRVGAAVIDNSSAFRADSNVPLVIPEINGGLLRNPAHRLIANPNCSTIIMLIALEPLRTHFGVERIVVSTYQAVSGAGAAAMDELRDQARVVLDGGKASPRIFAEPCAFNVFSHNAKIDLATGLNGEEAKMISESRKIWDAPTLSITPTCVRVPVLRAHTQSITVTLTSPATEAQVRAAFDNAKSLMVIDDRANNAFPTPLKASHQDDVLIGRIRHDPGETVSQTTTADGDAYRSWCLLVSGDQLRKGAALNAIQIADALCAK